jgi:hypothetical protein
VIRFEENSAPGSSAHVDIDAGPISNGGAGPISSGGAGPISNGGAGPISNEAGAMTAAPGAACSVGGKNSKKSISSYICAVESTRHTTYPCSFFFNVLFFNVVMDTIH